MSDRDENGRFIDYDLSAEDYRARRRNRSCHCVDGVPGHCHGPDSCPYADHESDEDGDTELCDAEED